MPIGAAIGGAAVIGAGATIISGNKAAKAQTKAADKAASNERYFYNTTRADYAPWRAAGVNALNRAQQAYGLIPSTEPYGGFFTSPGYQFRFDEGIRAIERGAAATGRLHSGATMRAEQRYGEGLGASEYDAYTARLAQLAGLGQSATAGTAAAGASAANGISNALITSGNARASSYANTGSAINQGLNNIMSAYLMRGAYGTNGG